MEQRGMIRRFVLDWILMVIILIAGISVHEVSKPYRMPIPQGAEGVVSYPLKSSSVSTTSLAIFALVPFFAIYSLFAIIRKDKWEFHHGFLCQFSALSLNLLVTDSLKFFAGRLRPHFLSVCPDQGMSAECIEARLSFPSGHSSFAFCAMTLVSLYLAGKLRLYSNRLTSLWKLVACVYIPQVSAAFLAISRTRDFHHNFADIVAGSAIGVLVAQSVYFLFFPSLVSDSSDKILTRGEETPEGTPVEELL
jgi:membrane-associated phospholipid phosphatase